MRRIISEIWHNEGRPAAMSILDLWRAALHFPVGCFAGWLLFYHPIAGLTFALCFLTYEVVEDWRIGDRGYKDIFGCLAGIGIVLSVLHFMG